MKNSTTNTAIFNLSKEQVQNQVSQTFGNYQINTRFEDNQFILITQLAGKEEKEMPFDNLISFNKKYKFCVNWGLKQMNKVSKTVVIKSKTDILNEELATFLKNYKLSSTTFGSTKDVKNQKIVIVDYRPRKNNPFIAKVLTPFNGGNKATKTIELSMKEVQKLLPA